MKKNNICYLLSIIIFIIYLVTEFYYKINYSHYFFKLSLILLSCLFSIIGNKLSNYKYTKLTLYLCFIYYIILLFNMVIFTRRYTILSYNIIPFSSIIDIITNYSLYTIIINIFGNLFIFMPLNYFLIELFNIKSFKLNLFISFLIILFIEIIQFIFKVGVFDIDDLIICTSGMMLFYIFYKKYKLNN